MKWVAVFVLGALLVAGWVALRAHRARADRNPNVATEPPQGLIVAAVTPGRSEADRSALVYVEADSEERADLLLDTSVTIDGVFTDERRTFRLKRARLYDDEGLYNPPSWQFGVACGRTEGGRGFGYGGAVNFDEGNEQGVTLNVGYYWTTRDGVRGKISRTVTVPTDKPAETRLSESVLLTTRPGPAEN